MPAKKGGKDDKKKGGKAEPEKPKEEEKKGGKDDKKGGGKDDKGKGGKDDKKGGKDDKKGGKDDKKGGKGGKDDKKGGKGKGKKEESEEEEEMSEEEELSEEEEDSEDDPRAKGKGKGKGKGKPDPKAKGKGKGKSRGDSEEEDSEEEDEDEEEEESEEEDRKKKAKGKDVKGKGGKEDPKKAKAKGKPAPPPGPDLKKVEKLKRGLKNTSKLFMRFSGFKRRRNSRKKLKSTSRLFLGLGKRKNKIAKKKRRKSLIKHNMRFMMRFRKNKDKDKKKDGNKSSYMLLRLDSKRRRPWLARQSDGTVNLKNPSTLLGKIAGATNWLTKRFLSTKQRQRLGGGRGGRGFGMGGGRGFRGRQGSRRPQMSMGSSFGSRQTSMRGFQNPAFLPDDFGAAAAMGFRPERGSVRRRRGPPQQIDPYGGDPYAADPYGDPYADLYADPYGQTVEQYDPSLDQGYYEQDEGFYDPGVGYDDPYLDAYGADPYLEPYDPYAAQDGGLYQDEMGYEDGYEDAMYAGAEDEYGDFYGNGGEFYDDDGQMGYYDDMQGGGGGMYDPYGEMMMMGDPYAEEYPDPYGADPYAADPYAMDPYAMDPYAMDPYAMDPYAMDPYAMDPYAQAAAGGFADPYTQVAPGGFADPYGQAALAAAGPGFGGDPYGMPAPGGLDPYVPDFAFSYSEGGGEGPLQSGFGGDMGGMGAGGMSVMGMGAGGMGAMGMGAGGMGAMGMGAGGMGAMGMGTGGMGAMGMGGAMGAMGMGGAMGAMGMGGAMGAMGMGGGMGAMGMGGMGMGAPAAAPMVGDGFEEFGGYGSPEVSGMEFRVPRPQVKLFGKERMDVALPPPPNLDQYQAMALAAPFSPTMGGFPPQQDMMSAATGAFPPQPYSPTGPPMVPTPTAMLIKTANQPGASPLLGRRSLSPQRMSPVPQAAQMMGGFAPAPLPSPTPSRRSMAMMGMGAPPMGADPRMSPLPARRPSPMGSPLPQHRGMPPMAMGHVPGAPQPPLSPRAVRRSPRHGPPSPRRSPSPTRRLQPQPSFQERPMPAAAPMPGRMGSRPPSLARTSPPASPRGSFRRPSPPTSPRASMRQASPPPGARRPSPPLSPSRPFGARKMPPGASSPPRSPSPTLSRRGFAPVPPRAGPRSSSPTLSRRSTRLAHDPLPLQGSPGGRGRGRGRGIPMGAVRPLGHRTSVRSRQSLMMGDPGASPVMARGGSPHRPLPMSPGGPRSGQRPVGRGRPLMAGARHSGMSFGSPQPVKRGMMPPSSPQPSVRHFSRPTSPLPQMRRQGHPMAMSPGGMSMGMAGMGMAAPGMAAPMAAAAPMAGLPPEMYPMDPMGMGMGMGGLPPQVSPPMMGVPPQALDPASAMMGVPQGGVLSPSPPMMAAALSGSPLSPAQLAQLPADIFSGAQYLPEPDMLAAAQVLPGQPEMELSGAFPPMAGSPMLSSAMQNQQIRGAAYGAGRLQPLAQMPTDPQDPMNPMLASALQNPQLMGASFGASPLGMPGLQDPYAAAAAAAAADPYSSPQLSAALQSNPQLRQASYGMAPLQRPQSPYSPSVITHQYQEPGPGPALHSAIQNPALQNASYRSHLRRRGSQRSAHSAYSAPRSPHLGRALQNPYAQQASAYRLPDGTFYDSRKSPTPSAHSQQFSAAMRHRQHLAQASYRLPDGTLVGPQMTGPVDVDPTSPMLANALQQNQALRGASYRLPDGTFISSDPRYAQQQMTSPQLSRALQNPNLRAASYRLPDGTLVMGGEPQQPQVPSPNLAAALQQNPALRLASYTLPDGSVITVDPRTGKPTNPNLSTALQNELLRAASYRLPDGSIIDPRTGKPTNPNLSLALQNELLRGAAYRLPDGSLFSAQPKSTSPNLSAALQNEMLKGATYRLPDGSVISAYPKPTSPNLAGALQNEMMKAAKYRLPDGSIISAYPKPTSPNLAAALQNEMMKAASYRLPDGSLISAYPRPAQPNLSSALQNEMMKAANYRLPDGSLLYPKPAAPNLMGALRNEALKSATYRLPDGSLISACPQRNPDLAAAIQNEMLKGVRMRLPDNSLISLRYKHGPKVSSALLNQGLRGANFRLNQSSVLAKGFQANPYISDAMENLQVKGASFQLPSGLTTRTSTGEIIGPEGRYQVVGPRGRAADDHWARHARAGQTPEEVWASERVLPHGTVQNLSKWSMYRDEGMLESLGPPPMTWLGEREGEVPWVPEREEGEPTGPWFDKIYFIRSLPTMRYRVRREVDGIEDMTQLDELCEASVLKNLRSRYERELIYTYIGSILISVNPYQLYNIYGTDAVLQYEGHGPGDNPPHIFAIANTAYTTMMDAKKNQCVIISGESGSGKTEATKLVLRYLTAIHHKRNITQQILEATPLLESFGNAKTVRNDNSSRFGKFVEIFMEEGVISGAITSQYLLEKSRIVFQAKDERNYHIFYEMLAGLPSNLRQSFYLQEAETYYYLNQGGNCVIQGKDDGDDFRRLVVAMEILSFSPDDQNNIFRVLASILHLGNVFFHRVEVGGQEGAGVVSAQEIRVVAELLHISPEGLQKALTYKVTDAMREKIYTPLTVESAVDARDAVAKILYSLLFHWLTERINGRVYPRHEAPSIAILDIYGFEDLLFNSFEQLCINYANETLQAYFTRIIFRQEQEEYFREQISWSELSFTDNQSCIDLIVAKPHGILRILDDQNGFPQATDHTFLQKCHYHHGDNELYMRPKMPQPEFTIKHYAGRVTYQVQKFLDKNYDQLRQEVLDLFVQSRNTMVGNLFQKHADSLGQQRGAVFSSRGSSHTRKQTHTVAAKFQHSLQELLDKMERCSPYFVRCVKPNQTKDPGYFDMELVATQLRYLGILDTIRIRKEGYPIRIQFFTFLHRYKSLLGLKDAPSPPDGEQCVLMLRKLCPLRKGSYQVGVTKIFLKEELYALLESKRERMLHLAALILQRCIRMHFARVKFVRLRLTMIKLQARCRGYMGRMFYLQMRVNLIRFRSLVQLCANRQRYMRANIRQKRMAEQARLNREVINLSQLPVPAELAALLHHTAVGRQVHAECLALVESPRAEGAPQLTLPHDINNYLMTKYIRTHFRELKFGMLIVPLENSLTRLEEDLRRDSLDAFTLILRFMGDPNLNGAQENLFGNYIIQRGLAKPPIREEILAQLANQVWRNERDVNAERGWLLLATCLSAFYPTDNMAKYLLKFVSDYALNGYKALCQHKLLQALQKAPLGPGGSRCYPPSLLEWTAARKKAHMLLLIHCTDGFSTLCPVHSWSSGEEVASSVLEQRGVASLGRRGWSLRLQEAGHWVEIGGHDYLLDAVSQMELPPVFPSQRSFFLISTDQFTQPRPNASMSLFGGFDGEEEGLKRGSAMTTSTLPIAGGHYTQESGGERGMDNYLDSLFDPVLSDGTGDMEASSLTNRMRGAGGVGVVNGDSAPPVANVPYSPPGAVRVLPTMPVVPNVPVAQPVPDSQQDVLAQQQQAIINQQAVIMAQQMTMQAMAMVSSPPMSPPMSPPPTSPPPVMYGIPVIPPSPYAQFPPSPYAAPQQHTHPATNNTHTNTNTVTHTQPASTHTSSRNNAETNAGSSTVPQVLPRRPSEVGKPASANLNRDGKPAKKFAPVAVSGPMRAAPPGGEVVKSSVLRSEHIVPSHNIKDIIRQYQTPPAPPQQIRRREGGRGFQMKKNPHAEAMQILKPQIDNPPAPQRRAPAPTAVPRQTTPNQTIRKSKPRQAPPPAPLPEVSRELPVETESIQTLLHRSSSDQHYTYSNVPWKIYLRKEIFYPKDNLNNPLVLDLIFKQVVVDTFSEACVRITKEERQKMKDLFGKHGIKPNVAVSDEGIKKTVVALARESWEIYFSRLFPASGSVGTGVQVLAVSDSGVKLLKTVKTSTAAPDYFKVLRPYSYTDIMFVTVPSEHMLEFNLQSEKLILFTPRATHIKQLIDHFISQLKKDSDYVVAERNVMNEDRALLSFHKGDIIRLQAKDGLDPGQSYGCVVKKKVMYLEELKRDTADFGWRFGALLGRSGAFPSDAALPVSAPDFLSMPAWRGAEPQNQQGGVATSGAVALAITSSMAAHTLDPALQSEADWLDPEAEERLLQDSQYNIQEFAKKYFRQGDSRRGKDFKDPLEMLKFSKSPITESLIDFTDPNMNRVASEIFLAIMKFMGDQPLKGQSDQFVLGTFLKLVGEYGLMRDEAYCQVLKQITSNTSAKPESCQKGWRLLYILTAFYSCSVVLRPFMLHFLLQASRGPTNIFQGIAKACEQNLRKTFQFGGRRVHPNNMELKAIMAGRSSKRQLFLFPGGIERHLKVKTCSVAMDIIEELCYEMAVQRMEAMDEYTIFIVTNRGQSVRPLTKREYILDVGLEAEQSDPEYTFCFRRVIWSHLLTFDNELSVTLHFNQVLPDYLKGLLNVIPTGRASEQQLNQVAKLAALQHRSKECLYTPTAHEVAEYIPAQLFVKQGPKEWHTLVSQHTHATQALSTHQARAQFLGLVCAFPMFGSSFFYIISSSNPSVSAPCILAVNQNGLHFLHKDTHELLVRFPLKQVQATHTQRPSSGHTHSYPYVDILIGDLNTQRVTQLQLEQGLELCRVIAMHVENLLSVREKRLTLPPSEITLL